MPLTPTGLTIGGTAIDLGTVLADVTIRHGRTGYWDAANASTIQLVLLGVAKPSHSFDLGSALVLTCHDSVAGTDAPRFTGTLTDAKLDVDTLTLIGVGRMATLGNYLIGAGAWPAEAWSARVTRAFTEAGLAAYLTLQPPAAGSPDPHLLARDGASLGTVALSDYLTELGGIVDSAIADLPNGNILVQASTWRMLSGGATLDPAEVGYAPEWEKWLPAANIVNLTWGAGGASLVTVQDAGSVAQYGPRPMDVATTIDNSADATAIANQILARSAWAQWTLPAAPLLVGMPYSIGQPLTITELPPASPHNPWTPILEGWTDNITSDLLDDLLNWTMELALSDPLLSGLTLPWSGIPSTAAYQWNTINQTVAWRDATELDALNP